MKILLINPAPTLMETSVQWKTFVSPIAPLGIASIAAFIEQQGIEVKIIDQVARKMPNVRLLSEIKSYAPDVIGFSCLTLVMSNVKILSDEIRKFTDAVIVLGNIHPTLFADELLKRKIADVVVRGEGEVTTFELIKALKHKNTLHEVKGISFREKESVFHAADRGFIEELDSLPYPAWHLFDLKYYVDSPMLMVGKEVALPISGSRGCEYRCTFCAQDKMYPKPRYRKTSAIIKELEFMHEKFKVKNFGFIDANFPHSIDFGMQFCSELIESRLNKKIRWGTETRVDLVNELLLERMKEAGVNLILFGFESGNGLMMQRIDKGASLKQARSMMKAAKKLKIHTLGLFILGLPGETRNSCEETIAFAKELGCDITKFNLAVPYPGSRFFNEFYKNKIDCIEESERFTPWYDWASHRAKPLYIPEGMTVEELIGFQRKAMVEFYLKPRVIINFLRFKGRDIGKLLFAAWVVVSKYLSYVVTKKKELSKA